MQNCTAILTFVMVTVQNTMFYKRWHMLSMPRMYATVGSDHLIKIKHYGKVSPRSVYTFSNFQNKRE